MNKREREGKGGKEERERYIGRERKRREEERERESGRERGKEKDI
jgi:hypothetical protein